MKKPKSVGKNFSELSAEEFGAVGAPKLGRNRTFRPWLGYLRKAFWWGRQKAYESSV